MSESLTREDIIDFCINGMLDDPFLSSTTAENGFSLLKSVVERLFGDPVTWDEIAASKARWRLKRESPGSIHPSFWEEKP